MLHDILFTPHTVLTAISQLGALLCTLDKAHDHRQMHWLVQSAGMNDGLQMFCPTPLKATQALFTPAFQAHASLSGLQSLDGKTPIVSGVC